MSDQRIIELSQRNTLADNDFLVTDSQAGGTAKVPGSLFNNEFAAMENILGAKNLLPNNAVSKAEAGVVYTVNSDGTITATAESASTAISGISFGAENHVLKAGSYILSGMPANTSNGYIQLTFKDGTSGVTNTGGDTAFTLAHDERIAANAGFVIPSGATPNNVVCSPMIRPAGIRDNTYVPYAKTNKVLTDDVATLNTQLTTLNADMNDIFGGTGSTPRILHASALDATSTTDYPIVMRESGDEDYKGILIKDKNNNNRYILKFSQGHLTFGSWDSTGAPIVYETRIL